MGDIEIVNTDIVGVDHPVVSGFYQMLFHAAGRIQPYQSSYDAAQRILDIIGNKGNPDDLNPDDLENVFNSAGAHFKRVLIK